MLRVGVFKFVSIPLLTRNSRIWRSKYFKITGAGTDADAEGWCGMNEVQGCYQQISVHTSKNFGTNF